MITKINGNILIFGIPLLIILSMVLLAKSKVFQENTEALSVGITVDLLFTVPLLYFLLIKKSNIPKTTVVPLFVIGMLIATYIVPKEHQTILNWSKTWLFPILELGVIVFVVYKVRQTIKRYRAKAMVVSDFFSALKETCREILPKRVAIFLAMELAVFYYGFVFWKKKTIKENEFTYHKNSGTISLLMGFILIIGVETYVLHVLLLKWNMIAAWVATIASIYSGIQVFGFVKSMMKRPIVVENGRLYLRYGILSETTINISAINTIQIIDKGVEFDDEIIRLSPLGELESYNLVLSLKEGNTLNGFYGVKKTFKKIVLFIDDKHRFKALLDDKIND
ncbi:hypothetical protein ABW636_09250 [Aquimarina sp. 2201CG1-2-11]|uniref:hypothetical protein n=1 Tax=Aquimarina discodermiae TaxID=3231043 RepID=UPI0034627A08